MNFIMSGLDYHSAEIDVREKFSIQESHLGNLCEQIKNTNNLLGCVIIATCNRTEIYINALDEQALHPGHLLLKALELEVSNFDTYFTTRFGNDALQHLMETSAGLNSQIFGDDQIVSQVKKALSVAHNAGTTDSFLETIFRSAIASAKRIKTEVRLSSFSNSVAYTAVENIESYFGNLTELNVLVIGNGEMGRLASRLLIDKGACVTVTIREYKYKQVVVPEKCKTVMYSKRYENFECYDAVLSATTSPHYTISFDGLKGFTELPGLFIDLAVPRDIDPEILSFGITLRNMDALQCDEEKIGLLEARTIIEEYKTKFFKWLAYKMSIKEVHS